MEHIDKKMQQMHKEGMVLVYEIIEQLKDIPFAKDLSDIGNTIGFVIASDERFEKKAGYSLDSFYNGLEHGISHSYRTTLENTGKKSKE